MKNYALTEDEKNSFILNYKIVCDKKRGKQIIIYFATGIVLEEVYSFEREKAVLEKMKKQVLNASKCIDVEKNNIRKDYRYSILAFIYFIIIANSNKLLDQKTIKMLGGIELFAIIYNLMTTILSKNKIDNINKNKLFVDNMHLFNGDINYDLLSGIKEKSKIMIIKDGNLNINNVDKISYSDLDTLINNIRKDKCYKLTGNYERR